MSEVVVPGTFPGRVVLLARTPLGELLAGLAVTARTPAGRRVRIEHSTGRVVLVTARPEVADPVLGSLLRGDDAAPAVLATADDRWTVLGDGAHVEEVAKRLAAGTDPRLALFDLDHEPDAPVHTPHVTVVVERASGHAWLGAARHAEGMRAGTDVTVTALGELSPGDAVVLTSYDPDVDGGPLPVAARRHRDATTRAGGAITLLDELWGALRGPYRVAATTFAVRGGVEGPVRHEDARP